MKRQVVSSNWRDDLSEYVDISNVSPKKAKTDTKSREKVEEKEVNNKVVINPPMTEAFEELGGTIISIEEELSEEEMRELQRKKDKKEGRKPGKVEESNTQMKIHQMMSKVQRLRVKGERENMKDEKKQQKEKQKSQKGKKDQEQDVQMQERTMTPGEKQKDTKLKKEYDKSNMKDNMQDQYGKEEGKKVYFATIRKQAMEDASNPFRQHVRKKKDGSSEFYTDSGTPEQAKKIATNRAKNFGPGGAMYKKETNN